MRKVIQIQYTYVNQNALGANPAFQVPPIQKLMALCDDGTIWEAWVKDQNWVPHWEPVRIGFMDEEAKERSV